MITSGDCLTMEIKNHGAKKTLPEEAHTLPPVTQQQATLYIVRDNDYVNNQF